MMRGSKSSSSSASDEAPYLPHRTPPPPTHPFFLGGGGGSIWPACLNSANKLFAFILNREFAVSACDIKKHPLTGTRL